MGLLLSALVLWGGWREGVGVCAHMRTYTQAAVHVDQGACCLGRWNPPKVFRRDKVCVFCLNIQSAKQSQKTLPLHIFWHVPNLISLYTFPVWVWRNRNECQIRIQQRNYRIICQPSTTCITWEITSLPCERHPSHMNPYPKIDTIAPWRAISASEFCEFCCSTILK